MSKVNNKLLGQHGEQIAEVFLNKNGYKLLEKNYRYSRMAEIDIIAKEKDCIVFVEVKTRSSIDFGHPFEAINKKKIENIIQAGLAYLNETQEKYKRYRIDVIAIIGDINTMTPKIEHLKNVGLN